MREPLCTSVEILRFLLGPYHSRDNMRRNIRAPQNVAEGAIYLLAKLYACLLMAQGPMGRAARPMCLGEKPVGEGFLRRAAPCACKLLALRCEVGPMAGASYLHTCWRGRHWKHLHSPWLFTPITHGYESCGPHHTNNAN